MAELISVFAGFGIAAAAVIGYHRGYARGITRGSAAGYHSGTQDMKNKVDSCLGILRAEFLVNDLGAGPEFADMLKTLLKNS